MINKSLWRRLSAAKPDLLQDPYLAAELRSDPMVQRTYPDPADAIEGYLRFLYLAADAFSVRDDRMIGWCAYVRTQLQLVFVPVLKIKPGPVEVGNFLVQQVADFLQFFFRIMFRAFQDG